VNKMTHPDDVIMVHCSACYQRNIPADTKSNLYLPHKDHKGNDCGWSNKPANLFCEYCGDEQDYNSDYRTNLCETCFQAEKRIGRDGLMYINAYMVGREYGGPQEGGWWYDTYEPIASIPVAAKWVQTISNWENKPIKGQSHLEENDPDKVQELKEYLKNTLEPEFGGQRSRFSVIGGEDLVICLQDHPAEYSPKETPHYE
jgi:hypothetical protein